MAETVVQGRFGAVQGGVKLGRFWCKKTLLLLRHTALLVIPKRNVALLCVQVVPSENLAVRKLGRTSYLDSLRHGHQTGYVSMQPVPPR